MAPTWRRALRWPWTLEPAWLLAPSVVVTLAIAAKPILPHDYWLHLALGRIIAEAGQIPRANLLLYTLPPDLPFHDQPWLGQWLMYRLYAALGHHGNAIALGLLALVTWFFSLDATLHRAPRVRLAAALCVVAVLLSTPNLTVRTQMFAFPLHAALLWVLFGVADARLNRRWLWLLPPLIALWANLHGSFALGIGLVGLVGLSLELERFRAKLPDRGATTTWAAVIGLSLLAGMASPIGRGNYGYVLTLLGVKNVTEWQAPDPRSAEGALIWLGILLALGIVLRRVRLVRLHELAVLLALSALAASGTRSVGWWAIAMPIVVAPVLAASLREREPSAGVPVLNVLFAGTFAALIVLLQPGLLLERARIGSLPEVRRQGEGAGLLSVDHPLELVERVAAEPRSGKLFHEQRIGGLVELALTSADSPRQVAFVDQRMELVPERVWDEYFQISRGEDWERRLDAWGVSTLILHERTQRALLDRVRASPRWRSVAHEGPFWLLERRERLSAPVFYPQPRDAAEFAHIVGHEDRALR